jgi:hypothetical protein
VTGIHDDNIAGKKKALTYLIQKAVIVKFYDFVIETREII